MTAIERMENEIGQLRADLQRVEQESREKDITIEEMEQENRDQHIALERLEREKYDKQVVMERLERDNRNKQIELEKLEQENREYKIAITRLESQMNNKKPQNIQSMGSQEAIATGRRIEVNKANKIPSKIILNVFQYQESCTKVGKVNDNCNKKNSNNYNK